jgi:tetratricopeptide (TPR) repeat protein
VDDTRWRVLQEVFWQVRTLATDERERHLAEVAGHDAALVADVRSLLAADASQGLLDEQTHTPLRDLLSDTVPERVGPYVIAEKIGRGGMGVVYRAYDHRLQRDVALKFLPSRLLASPTAQRRFVAEARAASALDHPNICTIHDIGSLDDGRLYIAMAYYGWSTLAQRMARGALDTAEAVRVASQVARALDCAHTAGIVHRDIKPANIAFGERCTAKVLDFGVATLTAEGDAADAAGTPAYMAPEQIRGEAVDRRADIWALGLVLHEMLCGRRAFDGADGASVRHAIIHAQPPDLGVVCRDLPPALIQVVARALKHDPAARFATAAEMAEALDSSLSTTRAKPVRGRRLALGLGVAVPLVITFTAIIAGWLPGRATGTAGPPSADAAAHELFLRGQQRYHDGSPEDLEAAIVALRGTLDRDPTHAAAHAFLANAYAAATSPGNRRFGEAHWVDSAGVHARRAIMLAPRLPDGHTALGNTYQAMGRYEEALAEYRAALDVDPTHALSMAELAYVEGEVFQRLDQSVLWYERALAVEPTMTVARAWVAMRYRQLNLLDRARRHVVAGLEIAADDPPLHWTATLIELAAGDTTASRTHFESHLRLRPASEHPRLSAWFAFHRGDLEEGLRHADRVDHTTAHPAELRMFGWLYRQAGEIDSSEILLRRAEALHLASVDASGPVSVAGAYQLALTYAMLGESDQSLRYLQRWMGAGGARSWSLHDPGDAAWVLLSDDPRFREIVASTDARLETMRRRAERLVAVEGDG